MANENKRDYYEVLGLKKDATDADIKRAYRKLAAQYHPDVNHDPGAEEKFKEINEANEVLSDPDKRARYDQYGFAGVDPNFNPNAGGSPFGGAGFGDFGDLGDIFGLPQGAQHRHAVLFRQLFRRRRPQHAPQRQRPHAGRRHRRAR